VKSFGGKSEYDDESETYQSFSSEVIYTDGSNEEEVGLYALKAIPKVGALFQADQRVRRDEDQPPPCVLTEGEIVERVNKIQLGLDLRPEEREQYEDLLRKYIHFFAFSYKDLKGSHHGATQN
jgi:hypothetical protein